MKLKTASQTNVLGICFMLVHVLMMVALYSLVNEFTKGLTSSLVVFLYKVTILVCIIPWCFYKGFKPMKTNRVGLHIVRGFLSVFAQICMFYGVKHLVLLDVTAIQYLEHVIVLIIGIMFFGERATKTKFAAMIVSIIGMVLVVKPDYGLNNFNYYFIFVFIGLILYAINDTTIKMLGKTEKTKVQLFYVTLVSSICSFPLALMQWQPLGDTGISYPSSMLDISSLGLEPYHFWVMFMLATCYFIHAVSHFQAFKRTEISTLAPLEYTRLIFAAIISCVFFDGGIPAEHKIYGYILITVAGLLLVRSEKRRSTRKNKNMAIGLEVEAA